MSEKRSPYLTIVLKKPGKPGHKIEMFKANLWSVKFWGGQSRAVTRRRIRIRVDGKWWDGQYGKGAPACLTMSQFWNLMERSEVALRKKKKETARPEGGIEPPTCGPVGETPTGPPL